MGDRAGLFRSVGAAALWSVLCFGLATVASAGTDRSETGATAKTPVVMTSSGPIVGTRRGNLSWFLGIPYAAPPVGGLRWRPPEAPRKWVKPREVVTFGNWCTQVAPEGFSKPILNEDCLYLNVVTSRDAARSRTKRPVIVWIHGGGLRQGRSNDYDPTLLVDKGGVVFVSFNYRLNIFGFLAHPDLDREGHPFANYGLMDQQFALTWVRRNIAAFGGDPDNVTLMGESSGGANVFNHLVSPRSTGLFGRAIIQSGSLWFGDFAPFYDGLTLDAAEKVGLAAADLMGCPGHGKASCLRSASTDELANVIRKLPTYSFGIVVDGTIMSTRTREAVLAGHFMHVPILNGSNHDEWTWVEGLHEAAAGRPLAEDEMQSRLAETFGERAHEVLSGYPASAYGGSAGAAVARAVTDGLFLCPLLAVNRTLAKYTKVWAYEFADTAAPFPFRKASFPYGAAHTLEMRYIFKDYTGAVGDWKPLTPGQQKLSDAMVSYWATFARTGNPNSPNEVEWPALTSDSEPYLTLVAPRPELTTSAALAADHHCDSLWRVSE